MSLINRLKSVQVPDKSPVEDMNKYSMAQLEEMTVEFGTTHKGKSFIEVWTHNQSWIKWFVEHYHNSAKPEHLKMLRFIELKVERLEMEGATIPLTDGKPVDKPENPKMLKAQSKMPAKAKSVAAPPMMTPSMSEETEPWEEVDVMQHIMEKEHQETREEVQVLQSRMLNIENALQSIMSHLQAQAASTPSPTGY